MRDKLLSFAFLGGLLTMALLTVLLPKKTASFYENRQLAAPPEISVQGILDGSTFSQTDTWVSDHLAFRNLLLMAGTKLQLTCHAPVINGVVVSGDTLLPYYGQPRDDYDHDAMDFELDLLARVQDVCDQRGIVFLYVAVPEQSSAFRDRYPSWLTPSSYRDDRLKQDFFDGLAQRDVNYLDMTPVLSRDYDAYYPKTDHHYNLFGAQESYRQILLRLQAQGLDVSEAALTLEEADTSFLGSRARKLMGLFHSQDRLYTAVPAQPVPFTRQDNGQDVPATVYDESQPHLYGCYMGGDQAETRICTDRPNLPDVLIAGDSFTNALESILYLSFDEMRSLDFRYYTDGSIFDYLDTYEPDALILVRDDLSLILTQGNGALGTN